MTNPHPLRIGALFAGYGGLDEAIMDVLDAELQWFAEWDEAPAKIMAHHHPHAPNLRDVTTARWSPDCPTCHTFTYLVRERDTPVAYHCRECDAVHPLTLRDEEIARTGIYVADPVDVISGGSPCQDVSGAGKRKGMRAGTRSGLWAAMCDAIDIIRPRLVVWENVGGVLSAQADSDVECCPGCVGDEPGQPALRALGRVLGDLAGIGYDARWYGLRVSDVGGAHGRLRVFVVAAPAHPHGVGNRREGLRRRVDGQDTPLRRPWTPRGDAPTSNGRHHWPDKVGPDERSRRQLALLPTPTTDDAGNLTRDSGDFQSLTRTATTELLPTPGAADNQRHGRDAPDWRAYGPAIRRAEHTMGRPAPDPTEPGPNGKPALSPAFVEWLMMLPAGHVTDVPGLTRNERLRALGNGVVPPQAAAALRAYLLDEFGPHPDPDHGMMTP